MTPGRIVCWLVWTPMGAAPVTPVTPVYWGFTGCHELLLTGGTRFRLLARLFIRGCSPHLGASAGFFASSSPSLDTHVSPVGFPSFPLFPFSAQETTPTTYLRRDGTFPSRCRPITHPICWTSLPIINLSQTPVPASICSI